MYIEFYDNLCFELFSQHSRQLKYLCSEFPAYKKTSASEAVFRVELVDGLNSTSKGVDVDNGRYVVCDNAIFRNRDSMFLDNGFCLDFSRDILTLKISPHIISQRYMLLRMIYSIMRFFLLKKNGLLLKASCTSLNGSSILYTGWSGTGKTTSILNDLASGRKYVSDTMSIVSSEAVVSPFNNALHVFWRNHRLLKKVFDDIEVDKTKILYSLFLRRLLCLLTLKKKELSTMVDVPEINVERNKTKLSEIIILNGSHSANHEKFTPDRLEDILYSINHSECFEFNRLLDVFFVHGIRYF